MFKKNIALKQFSYKFYQIHNVNKSSKQTMLTINHLKMLMPNLNFRSKYN